jgi:hypothetical protein
MCDFPTVFNERGFNSIVNNVFGRHKVKTTLEVVRVIHLALTLAQIAEAPHPPY